MKNAAQGLCTALVCTQRWYGRNGGFSMFEQDTKECVAIYCDDTE